MRREKVGTRHTGGVRGTRMNTGLGEDKAKVELWRGRLARVVLVLFLRLAFACSARMLALNDCCWVKAFRGRGRPRHTTPRNLLPYPQPAIFLRCRDQAFSDWILQNVLLFFLQAFVGAKHVIEGLVLPDWSGGMEHSVDTVRGGAFQALQ